MVKGPIAQALLACGALLLAAPALAQQPALRLEAAPMQVEAGEAVTFTAELSQQVLRSLRVDARLTLRQRERRFAYVFAFGDGKERSVDENQVSHVYREPGPYRATVRLEVNGDPVAESRPVLITVTAPAAPPTVRLAADPTEVEVGEPVTLAAVTDRLPEGDVRYVFDFGDGNQRVERGPRTVWTYQRPGRYAASVQVRHERGIGAESARLPIVVSPPSEPPPTVRLLANLRTPEVGESVTFTAAVDPPAAAGAYEYVFRFGNGEEQRIRSARVRYDYPQPGRFQASVQLLRRSEVVARSRPVTITAEPLAVPPDEEPVRPPDSPPQDLPDPPEDVDPPDDGRQEPVPDDPEPDDPELEEPLRVGLEARPQRVLVGEPVVLVATASRGGGGDLYAFVLDGQPVGEPGSNPTLTRTFEQVATVIARVRLVRNGDALAESEPVRITVTAPPPPVALSLYVDLASPRAGDAVRFWTGGIPAGAGIEYQFRYGDGEVSGWLREGESEHVYAAAGPYDAQVEVRGLAGVVGSVTSGLVRVAVTGAGPSLPLWVLGVVGAAVLFGAVAWRRWRPRPEVAPEPPPAPPPLVGLKARLDDGVARVAVDRPLTAEWEVCVRPVDDEGDHQIETREFVTS